MVLSVPVSSLEVETPLPLSIVVSSVPDSPVVSAPAAEVSVPTTVVDALAEAVPEVSSAEVVSRPSELLSTLAVLALVSAAPVVLAAKASEVPLVWRLVSVVVCEVDSGLSVVWVVVSRLWVVVTVLSVVVSVLWVVVAVLSVVVTVLWVVVTVVVSVVWVVVAVVSVVVAVVSVVVAVVWVVVATVLAVVEVWAVVGAVV